MSSNAPVSSGRPPAVAGSKCRAGAVEIERALKLIGAALGLSERQRDHKLQAALPLRDDPRAMLVERACVVDAGGAAGPGREARRRSDELQADIAACEALDPPWNVAQLVVERDRAPSPCRTRKRPAVSRSADSPKRGVRQRSCRNASSSACAWVSMIIGFPQEEIARCRHHRPCRIFLSGWRHGARPQVEQAGEL